MTEQEKELKAIMAYAVAYCKNNRTNIASISTEEVWQKWCEECERVGISPYTQLPNSLKTKSYKKTRYQI